MNQFVFTLPFKTSRILNSITGLLSVLNKFVLVFFPYCGTVVNQNVRIQDSVVISDTHKQQKAGNVGTKGFPLKVIAINLNLPPVVFDLVISGL